MIGWNCAVRVRVSAISHGVCVAHVLIDDRARTDAARRLTERVLRERSWIDGRHPNARLVDAIELRDKVLEVDIMIRVVVEDQLLEVPIKPIKSVKALILGEITS